MMSLMRHHSLSQTRSHKNIDRRTFLKNKAGVPHKVHWCLCCSFLLGSALSLSLIPFYPVLSILMLTAALSLPLAVCLACITAADSYNYTHNVALLNHRCVII